HPHGPRGGGRPGPRGRRRRGRIHQVDQRRHRHPRGTLMRGRSTLGALGTVALLALSACGAGSGTGDGGGTVTLEVAAAASLTSSFEEIAKAHEEEHEDVSIELQLAGSSDLATQIENGADPDVFASA